MAQNETENPLGFNDKRRGTRAGQATSVVSNVTNLADVAALRARLTAAAAASYPASRLDKMTKNDMVYAVRLIDEAAGLK
jgi:hypothetical protein